MICIGIHRDIDHFDPRNYIPLAFLLHRIIHERTSHLINSWKSTKSQSQGWRVARVSYIVLWWLGNDERATMKRRQKTRVGIENQIIKGLLLSAPFFYFSLFWTFSSQFPPPITFHFIASSFFICLNAFWNLVFIFNSLL